MAYTPPGETRAKVYEFLRERLLAGAPPTVREVQAAFDFRSVESARAQLEALVRDGLLVKTPGKARSYRLADQGRPVCIPQVVPLLGRVQAGQLQLAVQDASGFVAIDARSRAEELFALRVQGESMTGVGILPGDIVIVRRQPVADPGDIVVAMVSGEEDEATIKTLRKQRGRWVLQPENPRFMPIVPDPSALTILGKVIEVRRMLEPPLEHSLAM
jgi:repressor LexA